MKSVQSIHLSVVIVIETIERGNLTKKESIQVKRKEKGKVAQVVKRKKTAPAAGKNP